MSTFFVAAVLVGIVAAICLLVVSLDKKQKRNAMNQLLNNFRQMGFEHNFTFSAQEILQNAIIGLDGVHRKLLVLERSAGNTFHAVIIDLSEVKSCVVKKVYRTINGGDLNTKKLEHYLQTMTLHFELCGRPPVAVTFFKHFDNHISEIAELESKAKHWENILSKMIAPAKKIA